MARLEEELADPEIAAEAKSVLRSMIKTIKIAPGAKRGEVFLEPHGNWRLHWLPAKPKGTKTGRRWRKFKSR